MTTEDKIEFLIAKGFMLKILKDRHDGGVHVDVSGPASYGHGGDSVQEAVGYAYEHAVSSFGDFSRRAIDHYYEQAFARSRESRK